MKVKDLMIPVAEYVTVPEDSTLLDVFLALEEDFKAKPEGSHAHRDVMVLNPAGELVGMVTMVDILRALEPNYRKLTNGNDEHTLTKEYVAGVFRDMGLWSDSLTELCTKAAGYAVKSVMHAPDAGEVVDEDDSIEIAIHYYIMGAKQPIVVRRGDRFIGVLRFSDIFEAIRGRMLSCSEQ